MQQRLDRAQGCVFESLKLTQGTRVSVGSGFGAEQRLRYAADPSQIVSAQGDSLTLGW